MKRWFVPILAFIGIIIVFAIFGGIKACSIMSALHAFANYQPPPDVVSATEAKKVTWRPFVQAIGSLDAVQGVDISSELAGKVVKIAFESGDRVKKGQLLVQLDDSQEQAILRQYQAQAALAQTKYDRALILRKKNLNAKQDLDNAREQLKNGQALVAQEQAIIDKKSINAPFDGETGIRQVNLGQYVTAGQAIVNLEQLSPLYVTFTLPQNELPALHVNQEVAVDVSAYSGKNFAGKITAINPAVNSSSRTVQVQATIPNDKDLLHPGMFVQIKIYANASQQKVVIPAVAINYTLYGDSVYVLTPASEATGGKPGTAAKPGKAPKAPKAPKGGTGKGGAAAAGGQTVYTAKLTLVQAGEQRGSLVAVTGLKPGDLVVTAGQIKLHTGSRVVINNEIDLNKLPELTP